MEIMFNKILLSSDQKALINISEDFHSVKKNYHDPKDFIAVLPNTPVDTVNISPKNDVEQSDGNNLQSKKQLASNTIFCMLLKEVKSSRENIPDHKDAITVVPIKSVDAVIAYHGSAETLSELCETPNSSHG